jgi:2-keto-4-pentenoate hydratase/2-oxohepta-3-ene-1,7-dioic acid hydratase in catechol pathway
MRLVTFSIGPSQELRLGVLLGDRVIDLQALLAREQEQPPASVGDLIRGGPAAWRAAADVLRRSAAARPGDAGVPPGQVTLHAPIPRPAKNVFCVGRNFASHAEESARARGEEVKIPTVPMFFTKAPTTVIGPYDDIPWDRSATAQVDWEAEIGVVIGTAGRNIRRDAALEHVFGYMVINDVTARDLQRSHGQFFKGKSLDGFCPTGPCIVTSDEFGDPHDKTVSLRVNGVVKQHGHTRDMIFGVDALIESLSRGLTLEPGDIIAAGTPDGVGYARTPPEFLGDGDVMETEVEGIGVLRNRVVAHNG